MAVWNVNEAQDIIKDIIEDKDHGKGKRSEHMQSKSVAEKVRSKAAMIRKNERLS